MRVYKILVIAGCMLYVGGYYTVGQMDLRMHQFHDTLSSIIEEGIDSMAFPGAQVLVALGDSIVYHETWGYHTYEELDTVRRDNLYDLASVTKVTSGLPVLMQLTERGVFQINAPLKEYMREFRRNPKGSLTMRELLTHQGGMIPYIVYWAETLKKNGKYRKKTFSERSSKKYPIKITDRLFLHKNYQKKMLRRIRKSSLDKEKKYRYSGLIFQMMPLLISRIVDEPFQEYLYREIYGPLGIDEMRYNPLSDYPQSQIIPTEMDTFFRHQLIWGTVHDEAAAMLDGVSCNAGLFATAGALFKLFRMYNTYGKTADGQFIDSVVVRFFTSCQYPQNENPRGLGFDKPQLQYDADAAYVAKDASPASFGHSGFTGTFVWADPVHDMIFIFLSNRVYPFRSHQKLYDMNIRPRIHQLAYDFLIHDKLGH